MGQSPTPLAGGTLLPTPTLLVSGLATDASGRLPLPVPGGGGPSVNVVVQAVVGGSLALSNAVEIIIGT